jgi:PAS domain S-box-containing protein
VVIRFAVSRPLGQLADHMQRLRETGEIRPAANADSGDEIGTLARSFNELLGAQQKASSELGMLSAAVRHADEAIVILEQDGCIAWVNPAYERSRNVKNADLLGCRPNDVVEGCDDPATYLAIWASARAGKTWKGRLRTVVGDGRVVTEDVVVSPVLHAGQTEPGGYVMLMHDVSEQIALEAILVEVLGRPVRGGDDNDAGFKKGLEQAAKDHRIRNILDLKFIEAEQPSLTRKLPRHLAQDILLDPLPQGDAGGGRSAAAALAVALDLEAGMDLLHEGVKMHPPLLRYRCYAEEDIHQHRLAAADAAVNI